MRKHLLLAAVAALALAPSQAQQIRCDTVMGRQFCTGPNGYSSTQDFLPGGRTFGRDNRGNSWTTDTLGGSSTTINHNDDDD